MFPTMTCPNIETVTAIGELQSQQIMNTCMGMLTPLTGFLGVGLSGIIPTVPVLNAKLPDLLSGNPSDLLASVKAHIGSGGSFPGIPSPLFPDMKIPEFESISVMINLIKSYIMQFPAFIYGLINQACGVLKFSSMPALPTMPSLASIQSSVVANIPGLPPGASYLDAMKSGVPTNQMFNISMPGFPSPPALPDPLFPSIHYPEFEFYTGFSNVIDHYNIQSLQPCLDFCNNTLGGKIPFSFPSTCATFTPTV
jgi:hypothetical protein